MIMIHSYDVIAVDKKNEEIFSKIHYLPTAVHSWGESDPLESVSNLTWFKCSLQQERWDWNRKTVSNLRNISKLGFFSLSDSCEEKCWKFFFCSNIFFAFWLAFLLLCLTRARNSSKSTFPFPSASTSRNSLRTCVHKKIVKRISQRWTILIKAQLSLTRGIKFLYALASFYSKLY